jgi:hypothetical protein
LGLEYNGQTDTIMGKTRNNSELTYDKQELLKEYKKEHGPSVRPSAFPANMTSD